MFNELFRLSLLVSLVACTFDAGGAGGFESEPDAGDPVEPPTADGSAVEVPDGAELPTGIAPPDTVPGARGAVDGDNPVDLGGGSLVVFRVDAEPDEHVAFELTYSPTWADVELTVDRWDGDAPVELQVTDAGAGLRVLSVFDSSEPRTFWVRLTSDTTLSGAIFAVNRTAFADGDRCEADCERLLQVPLPNDPVADGYDVDGGTFRYQFGRRDLVMMIRHAGKTASEAGMQPFYIQDVSQWDGATPGDDVGSPRHLSHQNGKDVDISLYGTDGAAPFRHYCDYSTFSGGRECIPGTVDGFDGYANAVIYGSYLATGRVTMSFLDQELIAFVQAGAEQAVDAGELSGELLPLFGDGSHLQHWRNHDNHIHIRISEQPYGTSAAPGPEPFGPP